MNAQTEDARDHWRDQVRRLTDRIAEAEQAVTDAQAGASAVALEGGDLDAATRELALARDRLDALRTARGEAARQLAEADAIHAQRERDRALARARVVARERIEAGDHFDAFARELDPAFARWIEATAALNTALSNAGQRPISNDSRDYRLRAALWAACPTIMRAIGADRVSADHRDTLREISAAQAGALLAKGD